MLTSINRKQNKLLKIVKSAMAAKTLMQVKSVHASFSNNLIPRAFSKEKP